MKILFVTPYPLSRIRIRSYGFASQLSKMHDVTALMLCSNAREIADAETLQHEGIRVVAVQDRRIWKLLRALKAVFTGEPLQVAFDASPALRMAIEHQLATGQFDLLHVEFIRALGALPETLPIPAVWDAVDCISLLYEQGGRSGATWLLRWLGAFEARRVRAYERTQLSRFSQILVTAPRDREALLHLSTSKEHKRVEQTAPTITVLPHGIDPDPLWQERQERQPETLIFSGKMSFHANVAGALFLIQQI